MCDPRWLNVLGLLCDIAGALVLAWSLVAMPKQEIEEAGMLRLSGEPGDPRNLATTRQATVSRSSPGTGRAGPADRWLPAPDSWKLAVMIAAI